MNIWMAAHLNTHTDTACRPKRVMYAMANSAHAHHFTGRTAKLKDREMLGNAKSIVAWGLCLMSVIVLHVWDAHVLEP